MAIAVIRLMLPCLSSKLAAKDGKTNFGDNVLFFRGLFPFGSIPFYFFPPSTMSFLNNKFYGKGNKI